MAENNSPASPSPAHVVVCACTCRRPEGLRNLLAGLDSQEFTACAQPQISILIADNEVSKLNEQICQQFRQHSSLPLVYVPVHEQGISHARNACLDSLPPDTDFLAFIDDDEIPVPGWLQALLQVQQKTGSDVVYGPVLPVFCDAAPHWIRDSDFFAKPRQADMLHNEQEIAFAATCNCLMKAKIIHDTLIRFDPAFAFSGGEDKLFFRQIKAAGYHIAWAKHAMVRETVPPQRACLNYLLREAFRLGNVRLPVRRRLLAQTGKTPGGGRLWAKTLLKSLRFILEGISTMLASPLHSPGLRHFSDGACRTAEGLGLLMSLSGFRYQHYRSRNAQRSRHVN